MKQGVRLLVTALASHGDTLAALMMLRLPAHRVVNTAYLIDEKLPRHGVVDRNYDSGPRRSSMHASFGGVDWCKSEKYHQMPMNVNYLTKAYCRELSIAVCADAISVIRRAHHNVNADYFCANHVSHHFNMTLPNIAKR